jgi:hypothetical protein
MQCPDCGALMNQHAEKPLTDVPPEESQDFDHILGGVLVAVYCCPVCGKVEAEVEPLIG